MRCKTDETLVAPTTPAQCATMATMAAMAKVFGMLCMLLASVIGLLGVWGYLEHRGTLSSVPLIDYGDVTKDAAALYLIGTAAATLVVATIGASAVMAAHAVDRLTRGRYIPRHQQPAPPPTPSGQWTSALNPGREPLLPEPVPVGNVQGPPVGPAPTGAVPQA
jgi:hypothetical protein